MLWRGKIDRGVGGRSWVDGCLVVGFRRRVCIQYVSLVRQSGTEAVDVCGKPGLVISHVQNLYQRVDSP